MTSEIEDAVARVEGLIDLAARAGDVTPDIDDLKAVSTLLSAITASQAEVERLTRERDALKLQAQCWAMEARGQKATVQEAYQAVTGATGEPGDWNGARPIRDALQAAEARATRAEALVEEAEEVLEAIDALDPMELNPSNYDHDIACEVSRNAAYAATLACAFLAKLKGDIQ